MKWKRFKIVKKIISLYYDMFEKSVCLNKKMQLRTGDIVFKGSGANYKIGSDYYPVMVMDWSKAGKTIYLKPVRAYTTNNHDYFKKQSYLYSLSNKSNIILKATWRDLKGTYILTGTEYCIVDFSGYKKYQSPK